MRAVASAIGVLVADHDPLSRRVVGNVLRRSQHLDVVAAVDGHRPVADWPLARADVAVVGMCPGDPVAGAVRALVARSVQVVLVGVDWTRHGLDAALAAGAGGCLVKDAELTGLAGAVAAVAAGNRVLSPELLDRYVPGAPPQTCQRRGELDAVRRLTARERQVVMLLGEGMSTVEVARFCAVSNATVKSHVSHALAKLGVRNRLEAVLAVRAATVPAQREHPASARSMAAG